ncbi:MAG: DedA family protein [Syntrophus sp. (in: bacteria)]|nr:DedA family protein [Syntrophus sp. (in: bacteria)]
MENYIAQYGYIAILIGTFLEGETTVLLGGIFSKLHYMDLKRVMLWAFAGTFAGDCTFFFLGKYFGRKIIQRYAFLRNRIHLANSIIKRSGNYIIFLVRFFVGVRGIILLLLGCTDLKKRTFFLYSTLSALLWSVMVSLIGYLFGQVVLIFVNDVRKYELYIVPAVLVGVLLLIVIYRHVVKKREEKSYGDE